MYFSRTHLETRGMALILVALCASRLITMRVAGTSPAAGAFSPALLLPICIGSIALALLSIWRGSPQAMLYYPVLVERRAPRDVRAGASSTRQRSWSGSLVPRPETCLRRRRPTSDT